MGRTYSLNGFLNATLRRSCRTVLVEGPSDKQILHKIELERFPDKAGTSTIDHVGILDDPLLSGLGNKMRVLAVQARADQLAVSLPKISSVLATLTDREWDAVNFVAFVPTPWNPPVQTENRFITVGHSVENYHFDIDCVKEFLKYISPEHLSAAVLNSVERLFPGILVFATVLSLKIHQDSCIGRCGGLVSHCHIEIRNERVYLHSDFSAACATRQIQTASSIVTDVNSGIDSAWESLSGKDFTQWLPHGHIGREALWSAIAKAALLEGMSLEVAKEIAHGYRKERDRFMALWLSKLDSGRRVPLDSAIEWLHK